MPTAKVYYTRSGADTSVTVYGTRNLPYPMIYSKKKRSLMHFIWYLTH